MGKAVSPVLPGFEHLEVRVAKKQEEYETLPMLPLNDEYQNVLTRWQFTPDELAFILEHGYCYVYTMTFGNKIQPMYVSGEEVQFGAASNTTKPGAGDPKSNGGHS